MDNLKAFYDRKDGLLALLDRSKKASSLTQEVYNEAKIGRPLILDDQIASNLMMFLLQWNTHFVPGSKPAMGLCTGDFTEHEGKKYILGNLNVAFTNSLYLHITRGELERRLLAWDIIEDQVHTRLDQLNVLLKSKDLSLPKYFYDGCGLSTAYVPSGAFFADLKKVIKSHKEDQELVALSESLENQCRPFFGTGEMLKKKRDLASSKGHLVFHNPGNYFSMNSPAASGGASWFQGISDDIANAIPNPNNLLFFAMHSGKASNIIAFGGGTSPSKSITFEFSPEILHKLQVLVDNSETLKNEWQNYRYEETENYDHETCVKKVRDWEDLVYQVIKDETKVLVKEAISTNVLGIQFDISSPDGVAYLNPVISKSCWEENLALLPELEKPTDSGLAEFLIQYGERVLKMS